MQYNIFPPLIIDTEIGQARPTLHTSLMERMTTVLSQMLSSVPDEEGNDVVVPSQSDSGMMKKKRRNYNLFINN